MERKFTHPSKGGSKYETKSGLPVRIYATDGVNGNIHGAYKDDKGWINNTWSSGGCNLSYGAGCVGYNLVDKLKVVVKYVVTYENGHCHALDRPPIAINTVTSVTRVECVEGVFDE